MVLDMRMKGNKLCISYDAPCVSVKHRLEFARYPSQFFLVSSFIGRPILDA